MKKLFCNNSVQGRLTAWIATGLFAAASASADVTNVVQNFDNPFAPSQSFGGGYFGGDSVYSAVSVVPGVGTSGTSAAQQTNATVNLANGYAYSAFTYQETAVAGNTGTSIAQYTISFDARCSVANANALQVKISTPGYGPGTIDTAPANPGYGNDLTITTGYVHYSFNLGNATVFPRSAGFNPTAPVWQFDFQNNSGRGADPAAWTMDIDNLMVTMTATEPPVSINPPTQVAKGLNLYASTQGNAFYDRQGVVLQQNTGLGWVGQATGGNPVSYSFTVAGAPPSAQAQVQLYLVPNFGKQNSPDWNAPHCAVVWLNGDANQATMTFGYKVNQAAGNSMILGNAPHVNPPGSWDGITPGYLESGVLGNVTNPGLLGTWKVTFTSDTNITLIAPNGSASSLILPAYNAAYFAETTSFNVYLAMQAQNAAALNKAFVFSDFAVTGAAAPMTNNFMTDTTLNTTIWDNSVASGPNGVFVSSGSQLLLTWDPANSYVLQSAGSLTNPNTWNDLSQGPIFPIIGATAQVVSTNELAAGNANYFRLVRRVFTQLQVLLPGQINAPGTVLGYVGTPLPVSAGTPVTVTVHAVDPTFHILNSVNGDVITMTSSDGTATLPGPIALANGTASDVVYFGNAGSWTVTAQDITSATVTAPATSAAVTVVP